MGQFRKFPHWCFGAYCIALFSLLFLRGLGGHYDFDGYPYWQRILDRTNLIPFATITEQVGSIVNGDGNRGMALRNLGANLLMFVPMGIYLPLLWPKLRHLGKCLGLWIGMILTVELVQLLTLQGSFDIDDVILNTLGFLGGFVVFKLLNILIKEER